MTPLPNTLTAGEALFAALNETSEFASSKLHVPLERIHGYDELHLGIAKGFRNLVKRIELLEKAEQERQKP